MNFTINNFEFNFDEPIHFCDDHSLRKILFRVPSTRYLNLIFDFNIRWNLHTNNLVKRLRILNFSFYNFRNILPLNAMKTIYLALYQFIFQYGLLVWDGLTKCPKTFKITTRNTSFEYVFAKKY